VARITEFQPKAFSDLRDGRLAISLPPQTCGRYVKSGNVFGHSSAYYEHSTDYNVPATSKTIAHLDRGPLLPIISAMSRFSQEEHPFPVLNNFSWTEKVNAVHTIWCLAWPRKRDDDEVIGLTVLIEDIASYFASMKKFL
jgi:hypothetical protein